MNKNNICLCPECEVKFSQPTTEREAFDFIKTARGLNNKPFVPDVERWV